MKKEFEFHWDFVFDRWELLAKGLGMTLWISFLGMIVALALGLLIALMRMSKFKPFNSICSSLYQYFSSHSSFRVHHLDVLRLAHRFRD